MLLAVYNTFISRRRGYGVIICYDNRKSLTAILRAMPAIGAPVIILTGMFSGIVTPTEAAGLAVVYAFIVGTFVYRELKPRDFVPLVIRAGQSAGSVLLILMVANAATFVFTVDLLPMKAAGAIGSCITRYPNATI